MGGCLFFYDQLAKFGDELTFKLFRKCTQVCLNHNAHLLKNRDLEVGFWKFKVGFFQVISIVYIFQKLKFLQFYNLLSPPTRSLMVWVNKFLLSFVICSSNYESSIMNQGAGRVVPKHEKFYYLYVENAKIIFSIIL